MKKYTNLILIKETDERSINGIILTNESEKTIQEAIYKAKSEFYNLDEMPDFVYCEWDYIYQYLLNNYDIDFLEDLNKGEVYY